MELKPTHPVWRHACLRVDLALTIAPRPFIVALAVIQPSVDVAFAHAPRWPATGQTLVALTGVVVALTLVPVNFLQWVLDKNITLGIYILF